MTFRWFFFWFWMSAAAAAAVPARTTVRVQVWSLERDRAVVVAPVGAGATARLCAGCAAERLVEGTARAEGSGLAWTDGKAVRRVAEMELAGGVRLKAHGETVTLSGPVRLRAVNGVVEVVATLPVERYVEMVVAAESGAEDGEESRKALAVVARSYAMDRTQRHAGFDVCDSTHCQRVRWRTTAEAHAATLGTAGESLWWNGGRMGAYFHQNCGGRTAAAGEIWPGHAGYGGQEGLVSRTDPYCVRVGGGGWSTEISLSELTGALAAAGLARPGWKTLRVVKRSASGRAAVVEAGGARISGENFRLAVGRALGWNRIKSDWFEVGAAGSGFVFHGRGTGHGVGLCQVGAAEMGCEGKDYREILAQYFPGARVADETSGRAWQRIVARGFALETTDAGDGQFVTELGRALETAESRSGLRARGTVEVRAYATTESFRGATLAPGWVAAFTEGDRIALQPLRVLAGRKLLVKIALHELLHVLVEEQAGAGAPLWLREGLVEVWAGAGGGERPSMTLEEANRGLAGARTEVESEVAHRAVGWYAGELLRRYGRGQVMEWLRVGIPRGVAMGLR
jgi:stage II sporulation protein D